MLNQGNKIFYFALIAFSFSFIFSCKQDIHHIRYDEKELKSIRSRSLQKSIDVIGEIEYWSIYKKANDTLNVWLENKLSSTRPHRFDPWQLDSLVCFNREGNKFRTIILTQCTTDTGCVMDDIEYFYGVKIKENWFFFYGPTMYLPREYYQEDIHTHLSFELMKQIATSNIYRGYLKKNRKGKWEINDNFFSDITSGAWGPPENTKEQWDSTYLSIVKDNWSRRDTTPLD